MLSIVEFAVYGFITYASLLMLIISVVKEVPSGKSQSIVRSIWLIPGIFTASLLAGAGDQIDFETHDITTTDIGYNVTNTNQVITNSTITTTTTDKIYVSSYVFSIVHFMILAILAFYVILQMLLLLTKIN